ncbi:MAG: hypothetical protein J7L54_02365 [Elusimicrobia bacterium]|nr:hypothetical protein [Elusimicrobiota bacterium]
MIRRRKRTSAIELRDRKILLYVVKEFLENQRPTGSKLLNSKYNLGVSPATVRNIFAFFEKEGYLTHSFSCSGRIPTAKGLRFYVENILDREEIMDGAKITEFEDAENENDLLEKASHFLSLHSSWVGISGRMDISREIREFEIKMIDHRKILIILITTEGEVLSRLVKLPKEISVKTFNFVKKFLKSIDKNSDLKRKFRGLYRENQKLIELIKNAAGSIMSSASPEIYTSVSPSVFAQDDKTLSKLFTILEDRQMLISQILGNIPKRDYEVSFCNEKLDYNFENFAIVLTNFRVKNRQYLYCVLGKQFMNYINVLPLVRGIARSAEKRLKEVS